jgi:hypothetical protein
MGVKQWEYDAAMEALRAKREQQSFLIRGYLTEDVLDDTARTVLEARDNAAQKREAASKQEKATKTAQEKTSNG